MRIEKHYPCLPLEKICALPVGELATKDAILFLWTTTAHLMQARDVIEAWGFTYRSNFVWDKLSHGNGNRVLTQHEHLLIAVKGRIPHQQLIDTQPSMIYAKRRGHSVKPDEAYAIIERMYPVLQKIELFARSARPGWDSWGNEAPPADEEDAA
jgi:N6-adenosine-specific RNA methylase IME4